MRARLAKAAYEVMAERGHSAFRTAAVAAWAGVSEGAQLHHFATKEQLALAALDYALREASIISEAKLQAIRPSEDPLLYMLTDLAEFFQGPHYWVALDIAMDGVKNPGITAEVRDVTGRYRGHIYAKWAEMLVAHGWTPADAAEIVRMAAATMAGMGMRSMWESVEVHMPSVIGRLREMILHTWPQRTKRKS
jgi:AcrR family transcriptional regulator